MENKSFFSVLAENWFEDILTVEVQAPSSLLPLNSRWVCCNHTVFEDTQGGEFVVVPGKDAGFLVVPCCGPKLSQGCLVAPVDVAVGV